jgi:hypothetical protein
MHIDTAPRNQIPTLLCQLYTLCGTVHTPSHAPPTAAVLPQFCMTSPHAAPPCGTPLHALVHLPHTHRCASTLDVGETGRWPLPASRHPSLSSSQ